MENSEYKIEKKFFCDNSDDLIYKVLGMEMKLIDISYEKDRYFTDIESKYIKDMICLRIRRKDSKEMEITYIGSSNEFNNICVKKECNIVQDIKNYDGIVEFLTNLGFYTYVCVSKTRKKYSIIKKDITYSIIVDDIKGLGSIAEFEVSSEAKNENLDTLKEKLNEFIVEFKSLNLREAILPYRDFVAREIYKRNVTRDFKRILVDISDVIPNINKKGIRDAICENNVILNLNLINKLMEKGIEVVIMHKDLSEDTLEYINSSINNDRKYIFKSIKDIENISLNDTLILKSDLDFTFSSLVFIILNWYGKEK